MNIDGDRITLRAIEEGDLPSLQRWANDPAIQSLLGGWHFPVSARDQKQWFDSLSVHSTNQRFAIETKDGELIGTANLVSIDWQNRTAFHGMLLGDLQSRGKGFAQDTVKTVMRYAFDELGLYRLDTDIIEYNSASLRLYLERCGWKKEGTREKWYYRKGKRWDKILIGISEPQYRSFVSNSDI
ncbi:GNAT family protein [Mesorhizobium sp. SP-1A]|uniref:GNAT family N-acetyltransferase n=1 Tax=Mesorhizobium sp. SP-1A TaxID=3077840 RepID=UPI0028F7040D|nr:GNAT family protein [Mesorhizobium sp. SP-1A]